MESIFIWTILWITTLTWTTILCEDDIAMTGIDAEVQGEDAVLEVDNDKEDNDNAENEVSMEGEKDDLEKVGIVDEEYIESIEGGEDDGKDEKWGFWWYFHHPISAIMGSDKHIGILWYFFNPLETILWFTSL